MDADLSQATTPNTNPAKGDSPIIPSLTGALAYCAPIAILPLMIKAAMDGSWWLAGPFLFLWLADQLDTRSGIDVRNMDGSQADPSRLFWYKLMVWIWVALYPIALIYSLHQVFSAAHLALWEKILIVLALGSIARLALNAGHDMMHRRVAWERRVGEVLMASVSFPQEITEHLYVHHAYVGTPADSLSPHKGQSFWEYLPRSVARSYLDTWQVERRRMKKRRLPSWHFSNPVWRYVLETAAWYALAFWIGGGWGIVVFALICAMGIIQLRMADYIQHYGLQRIRLPGGRYERVQARHSWSSAYRLSNWLYYNAQRHADHHLVAIRLYPLLGHWSAEDSPQLPGSYSEMGNLLLFPKRWFEIMDPLVDQWRERFYPEINDWRAYDSLAYRQRPQAFEAIAEIYCLAPSFAPWINRSPELLDGLSSREFTDLDLPSGFGPDADSETLARRGLTRLYWTRELDVDEMLERIGYIPAQNVGETVEVVRSWSNDKVFQITVHVMRGNLTPLEAGTALANIAEASVTAVLSAVEQHTTGRFHNGGMVALLLGGVADGMFLPGAELDVLFVHQGGLADKIRDTFLACSSQALSSLSNDNLLFVPALPNRQWRNSRSLEEFMECQRAMASADQLLDLVRARRVFTSGTDDIAVRFDAARSEILTSAKARQTLLKVLSVSSPDTSKPELSTIEDCRGGLGDVERAARLVQFTYAAKVPELLTEDTVSIFAVAGGHSLISASIAQGLDEAARLWRNLSGILRLVANADSPTVTMSKEAEAIVAGVGEVENLTALNALILQTASNVTNIMDTNWVEEIP
ncbi:MAG: fatty acid desaturase [Gammaproteobacteria bacterium]|nr:fatty acid desaturase [Gammaproteobacteria bacterium]